MLNILVYGVLVHLVFLASIFIIYFQSPVIQGLRPQPDLVGPPAKRLVLFVADGLRAESFYRDGCSRTPFLRDVILERGVHGVSHTRIPTESRPGHVALIAGLYEDPSAVLRGWQENPVDFDSLFNRSAQTLAWGSPDILRIFSKDHPHIHTQSYDPADEDFSGATDTGRLDEWVFHNFATFMSTELWFDRSHKDGTVIFLHLLGLDTAGHVHKPNSARFDTNLAEVDAGIASIFRMLERHFHDERTAYVFTADHGMTDAGAHGAGAAHETETPFVAWGAGFTHWRHIAANLSAGGTQLVGGELVPRFDIAQADAAPLMATVLGTAVPMNNVGRLPVHYLNTSPEYVARAMRSNALQVAAQFEHLRVQHARGFFAAWLPDFDALTGEMVVAVERRIETALANRKFAQATQMSGEYLGNSLLGVAYYQQYYQRALLVAVCVSMVGWLVFLLQRATFCVGGVMLELPLLPRPAYVGISAVLAAGVGGFVYLQGIPPMVGAFFLLPIVCWMPCNAWHGTRLLVRFDTWMCVLPVHILVWTFFYRSVLGAVLLFLPYAYLMGFNGTRVGLLKRNWTWLLTNGLLGVFTLLPAVGRTTNNTGLLLFGLLGWLLSLTLRTFASRNTRPYRPDGLLNLALLLGAAITVLYVADGFERQRGLGQLAQLSAWALSAGALALTLWPGQLEPHTRILRIAESLCVPYALLSLSYEPLFLLTLATNLERWVHLERHETSLQTSTFNGLMSGRDIRRAYLVMVYVLVSFFGTGNLATISSFDPNTVRCFVGTFAPFTMAALIVAKLFVPVLLVMCASTAINASVGRPSETLFVIVLLISDIMCAHFLFFVRNTGSWLDIGVSISHFVIMESTVLVLCVLEWLSRRLLRLPGGGGSGGGGYAAAPVKRK